MMKFPGSRRRLRRGAFILLMALAFAPKLAAQEQGRIALIVTNQNYRLKELRLTNSHADGQLLKNALEAVGFVVTTVRDTPHRGELEKAIGEHIARLAEAGPNAVGFLYYSGHGAAESARGSNYLLPTEANITHAAQLPLYGLPVDQIINALAHAGGKMSFVAFDSCRNVPLQRSDKSTYKGFAPIREEPGLLIAYATEPGNVAVDDGLYARALAEEIVKQGREAGSAFRAVSRRVYEATGQRQRPEYNDRRFDDFVFKSAPPQVAVGIFPEGLPAKQPSCDGIEVGLGAGGNECITPGSGNSFRDCANCPKMVVVPAGRFTMGSPQTEEGHNNDENPLHEVLIAKPFAVSQSHITRGEFAEFVNATGYKTESGCRTWSAGKLKWEPDYSWRSPGFDQDDRHPVVCVSWKDAEAYANWLSAATSAAYRLLTEAEAEYATRGILSTGVQSRYFFGGDARKMCEYGNGADASFKLTYPDWPTAECNDGYVFTAPVAHFKPNAFGLHDVHGNVWSWTSDCWSNDYSSAPRDGSPHLAGSCTHRVLRGGSWGNVPNDLRAAIRISFPPEVQINIVGFRIGRIS